MEHGRGVRQEPQSSSIPTPRCNQGIATLTFLSHARRTYSQNGMMDYPRFPISEMHLGKFMDSLAFQSSKVNQFQDWRMCKISVASHHHALDQRS